MSINLNTADLRSLDESNAVARMLRMGETIEGLGAGIDVRAGFLHDYLVRLNSIIWEGYNENLNAIAETINPLLPATGVSLESTVIDASAASYGLTRYTAARSSGTLKITLKTRRPVVVPSGATFVAEDGTTVITTSIFVVRLSASELVDETDRILTADSDGGYSFTVDAVASVSGTGVRLSAGQAMSLSGVTIPSLKSITVQQAFTGGVDQESDEALLSRIQRQLPTRSMSSRRSTVAFLTDASLFPQWQSISIVGYGDSELRRATENRFSGGGAADIYVRSRVLPETSQVTKSAELTSFSESGDPVYTITLDRDDLPGCYYISQVQSVDGGNNLTIEEVTRGFDVSTIPGMQSPRIDNATTAAFSRYQTMTILVSSNDGGGTIGDTLDVAVSGVGMPDLTAAQAIVGSRSHRFVGGDTLVRAAVPIFVGVQVEVHARPGVVLYGADDIRAAVSNHFNSAGFSGRMHISEIVSLVNNQLPSGASAGRVEVRTETILPTGEKRVERHVDHVVTPNLPEVSATPRTCVFLCNQSSVNVTAYRENIPTID